MMDTTWTDEDIRQAKQRLKGPLGKELVRFPLRFSSSLTLWADQGQGTNYVISSATMSLIKLNLAVGITCAHVLKEYERLEKSYQRVGCRLGNTDFLLQKRTIDFDDDLDVATFTLEGIDLEDIHSGSPPGFGIHTPRVWPSKRCESGELTMIGGYPGALRSEKCKGELVFRTFGIYGTPIAAAHPDKLVLRFEREFWISTTPDAELGLDFSDLPGISGGPVFIDHEFHPEFAGIVTDFTEGLDMLLVCPAQVIGIDGKIKG
ncbi:MAG: trypsin-like peptidase domain-containing protein [bacterium]|nr:trypsin-like peptidase domain-containing protein [bacterium]